MRLNESAVSVPESVGSLQVCVELVDVLDGLQREVVVGFEAGGGTVAIISHKHE